MRVSIVPGVVDVYLSERNIETLRRTNFLNRLQEDNTVIRVHVESDAEHYADRPHHVEPRESVLRALTLPPRIADDVPRE